MTCNEMITSLGYRLEDTSNVNFTSAQKLVALNDAQRQAISMLTNDALAHTQVRDDLDSGSEDADFGGHTFFALPADGDGAEKLMNRVVKAYDNTNERFIEMVSPAGFETTNKYNYGTLALFLVILSRHWKAKVGDTIFDLGIFQGNSRNDEKGCFTCFSS